MKRLLFLISFLTLAFHSSGQVITTIAGNGTYSNSGDGGAATAAAITESRGIYVDKLGNTYFADANNYAVRKISVSGIITTVAGSFSSGFSGDGGAATAAQLTYTYGVTMDTSGNLYISDNGNRVRKVAINGIITTIAGTGAATSSGDGGAATAASINLPTGMAFDRTGNLYIAERNGCRIRKITPGGIISTVAGTGSATFGGDGSAATGASIAYPEAIAFDTAGNLLIADNSNNRIRKVNTSGIISTIAGTGTAGSTGDGGAATAAKFTSPGGIAVDVNNNIYVAANAKVRRINSSGTISTFCGTGTASYSGDGGQATAARINGAGITIDAGGNLLLSDFGNSRIRRVTVCALPAVQEISGSIPACTSGTNTLTDSTSGGSWSILSPGSVATISSGGVVTVTASGTSVVTYSVHNSCGTAGVSKIITAAPAPNAGTISGSGLVAVGSSMTLASTLSGGTWSSSNTSIASVNASTGEVSGIGTGSVTISYAITNSCGTNYATYSVIVGPAIGNSLIITTVAGNGTSGFSGDGSAATAAKIASANGVVTDAAGNLYLADNGNNRIRKVTPSGTISTIAGITGSGFTGDGGAATAAKLSSPADVTLDAAGNMYIADNGNNRIRKIDASGTITTVAGSASIFPLGDGGQATAAGLSNPTNVVVDTSGNIYISDRGHYCIRKVNTSGGISTIAGGSFGGYSGDGGSATAALVNAPSGLALDASGNLYIADQSNQRIRKISTSGIITTVAGTGVSGYNGDGFAATAAKLSNPIAVAFDQAGNMYISENNNLDIRMVTPLGIISTYAGTGSYGFSGDGGPATAAKFAGPTGIYVSSSGNLYIADPSNNRVRKVGCSVPVVGAVSGASTICAGSSTTYSDTSSGGAWSSSAPSIASVGTSGVVTGIAAGSATISYSVTNSCGTTVVTRSVTVNPLPNAGSISGTAIVCVAATTALSASGTSGGTWSSGSTSTATVASSGVVTGVASGSVNVSYSVTNGCGTNVATQSVTVNPLPNAGTLSGTDSVCQTASITLTPSVSGGTWFSSSSSAASVSSGGVVSGISGGSTTISYFISNSCGTAIATKPITVNPLPYAGVISGAAAVCESASTTLTSFIGGGSWSSSATGIATVSGSGNVTGVSSGSSIISYSFTNSCGTDVTTQSITVNPLPHAGTISGASSVCESASMTLASSVSGGSWSSTSTGVATVSAGGVVSGISAGTITISYSFTNSCGTDISTQNITVNPLPVATPIFGYSAVELSGLTALLNSQAGGSWSTSNSSVASVTATGAVIGVSTGTATISYTVSNSCGSATATKNMIVTAASATCNVISRVTGTGTHGYSGDGGAATAAAISIPTAIITDGSGNLYFSEIGNQIIRRISSSGTISTFAGTGTSGHSGDGGAATAAAVSYPNGFVFDGSGNLYFTSGGSSNSVRKISASGIISTIVRSSVGYGGDGGPASSATINNPTGITFDANGNLYFCEYAGHRIRKISTSGIITTVAGTGTSGFSGDGGPATAAKLYNPMSVVFDSVGNMYIADFHNNRIRKISQSGIISTICGSGSSASTGDGGPATAAQIYQPSKLAFGVNGDLFIDDANGNRIRKIDPLGNISTVAGTGTSGYSGDGGPATAAQISPTSLCVGSNGDIYFTGLDRVRKVSGAPLPDAGTITGSSTVCAHSTVSLSNTASGGSWSSSNSTLATVGSSGVVTGVAAGTPIISYSVTNSCGSAVATSSITVNPLPVAGSISGISSVCESASTTLTTTISGGSWSSSNSSIATVTSTGDVYGVAAGSVTISYSVSNSCGTDVATQNITVNPLPHAGTISGASTVCESASTALTSSVSGGSWTSSSTSVATVSATGDVIGITSGSATISYTATTSCGIEVATQTITVNPLPHAGTISGASTVCESATTTVTSSVSGGSWNSSSTSIASISATGDVTGITSGSATISYTVTTSCGTDVATQTITVNPLPHAGTISGASTVCESASTTLTSSVSGGSWTSSSTSVATVSATGDVTGITTGSATISYTATSVCGTDVATQSITVNPLPHAGTISGASTVCESATTTVTSSVSGGSWNSSSTSIASISATGDVTGITSGSVTISYTVMTSCGTDVATQTITVNPLPHAGTITGASTVCESASTTLTSSESGGTWTSSSTSVATVSATGDVTGITSGSATISYTATTSCGIEVATQTITVNPLPHAGTISGLSTVCESASTTLTSSVSSGTWSSSSASIASVSVAGDVTGISAGSATISYTATNSCGADVSTQAITVNPLPHAGTISGASTVCESASTALTSSVSGGSWSSSSTSIASVSATGDVTGITTGSATISYTATSICGTDVATQSIAVNPLPHAGTISGASTVCESASTALTSSVSGGSWTSSSTSIATVSATGDVTGISTGSATISYTATSICGTDVATQTITVNPLPHAGTISGASTVCESSSTALTSSVSGGTWSSSSTSIASISATGDVTGISAGSATISYTATSSCGTDVATQSLTVNPMPLSGSISGAATVCESANTALTSTVTGGTWSSGNTSIATVSTSGVVVGVSSGAVSISYSFTNTCGTSNAIQTMTINPLPNPGTISGGSSVCTSANITMTASVTGGTWSSNVTSIATVNSSGVVRGVANGTDTIAYTVTNSCGSLRSVKFIAVGPYAGVISGASNICRGSTTTLVNTLSGGTWSSLSTSTATISGSGVVTGVAGGGATLRYTLTNTCGTTNSNFNMIVSAPGVILSSSGPLTVCAGSSVTFTNATAPSGGTWSSSNSAIASVAPSSGVVSGITSGTATITYTTTNACGTVSTGRNITVTGTTMPAAISGSTAPVCLGSTLALTDGTTGGVWTSSNPSVATISTSGVVTATGIGTDTIYYSYTNSCGFTGVVSRTVVVLSGFGTTSGASNICTGTSTTLSNTASGGTWSSSNTSVATISSSGVVTGLTIGTVTISYNVTGACGSGVSTFSLSVSAPITVPGITGSSSVCPGATITLSEALTTGAWSSINPAIATVSTSGVVSALVSGTDTIVYSVTNVCGTFITSKTVTVIAPIVPAAITGSSASICPGATVSLADATTGGVWSSTDTSLATINSTGVVTARAAGTDSIKYTVTNTCGVSVSAIRLVTVLPLPSAGVITGPSNICTGSTATLTASGTAGGTWSSTNGAAITVSSSGIITPVAASAATIKYTVTNTCGTNVASLYIVVSAPGAPAGITGALNVCLGSSTTFSDATAGGTWSSANSSIATVSTTGVVTSVSGGSTVISYTVTNACGTYSSARNIAVNTTVPTGITISGPSTVVAGATIALTHAGASGTWSSVYPALATINTSGVVTGVSTGIDTIKYTVTNGCGTTVVTKPISITGSRGAGPSIVESEPQIRLYPNPTTGIVYLEINGNKGDINVFVTDISGKVIETRTTNEQSIQLNLGNVASGVYMVSVQVDGRVRNERIVVQ